MDTLREVIAPYESVSFIGMCKNAGKTTAFNRIVGELRRDNVSFAATSVGMDGESTDLVTSTAKPRIYVYAGTILATAAGVLKFCDITKEILRTTGIFTPLGEIIVLRALSDGFVQLAGPSITAQLPEISKDFCAFGAEKILIDGALGRKSLCTKKVSQSTILCTGASYDKDMEKVVRDTADVCELLDLSQAGYPIADQVWEQNLCKYVPVWDSGDIGIPEDDCDSKLFRQRASGVAPEKMFRQRTSGAAPEKLWRQGAPDAVPEKLWRQGAPDAPPDILVRGGLTDVMIKSLLQSDVDLRGKRMILRDGSRILLSGAAYKKLKMKGLSFAVADAIKLLAVTVNPFSVYGFHFDQKEFSERMGSAVNVPVFDVMADRIQKELR